MRILVVGATGVVGRRLVPMLVVDGHEVWGSTRDPARAGQVADLGAEPVVIDVLDRSGTFAAIEAARPDVVVHQVTDLSARDFKANSRSRVEGTPNLVDAALAVGVTRIVVQSLAFAYEPGTTPAVEADPLDLDGDPRHAATATAIAALEGAAACVPTWVALRYGALYGPGTWYAADGLIADQARRGELVADDAVTSFLHVDDAASMAVAALSWPSGAVNVVDDEPAPARQWLPAFAAAIGGPGPALAAGGEPWERGASNGRARTLPGWSLRYPSWRQGFAVGL